MEAVGLGVGIAGLAGLFTASLDAVNKVSSYKSYQKDTRDLDAQLAASRLRYKQWGQDVGLDREGSLSNNHHQGLDDQDTFRVVKGLLLTIQDICEPGAGTASSVSRWQKTTWALRRKEVLTKEVDLLGKVIQTLHDIVPPNETDTPKASDTSEHDREDRLTDLRRHVTELKDSREAEERKSVHKWLLGQTTQLNAYEGFIQTRLRGTCDWILNNPIFVKWLSPQDSNQGGKHVLWIHGPPGFGKTILCARLVEYLNGLRLSDGHTTPVGHFFFSNDNESRDDPFAALRVWVSQIAAVHPVAFSLCRGQWLTDEGQMAKDITVFRLLRDIMQQVPGCIFVVDGLDECLPQNSTNSNVAALLRRVTEAVDNTATRFLIVSRDTLDIRRTLGDEMNPSALEIRISCEDVRSDIHSYSTSMVQSQLSNKPSVVKTDISGRLAERCEGQFLWVKIQTGFFNGGMNQKQIRRAIEETPAGVESLYQRNWATIDRAPPRDKARAMALLRWAAWSLRPLTVEELTEAVLVDDYYDDFPLDELPDLVDEPYVNHQILGLCESLLEVQSNSSECSIGKQTVHLVHFSVKEYLLAKLSIGDVSFPAEESLRRLEEVRQNKLLAKSCLIYLTYQQTWQGASHLRGSSFREYAADKWVRHASSGDTDDEELARLTITLLDEESPSWHAWRSWLNDRTLYASDDPEEDESEGDLGSSTTSKSTTTSGFSGISLTREEMENVRKLRPLFFASTFGLTTAVSLLIQNSPSMVNSQRHNEPTALDGAAIGGHSNVVRQLLAAGAEIGSALKLASGSGRVEIVRILLDHQFDSRIDDVSEPKRDPDALLLATRNGHLDVVELLFARSWNLGLSDSNGRLPLHYASEEGHTAIVELLLSSRTPTSVTSDYGETPFGPSEGKLDNIPERVKYDWDLNALDGYGSTALLWASAVGNFEVVKLLFKHGADITLEGETHWTPLYVAAKFGHSETVKILLQHGANVSTTTQKGKTSLHIAARYGHVKTVEILLQYRADVNALNQSGMTPLGKASFHGHLNVVELLCKFGADVSATFKDGNAPLHVAAFNGHTQVVKLLCNFGADALLCQYEGGRRSL